MRHTLLIGTDFKTSSLKMREFVHFDDEIKPRVIRRLTEIEGIDECVILTTCNRVEIYLVCKWPNLVTEYIIGFLSNFHNLQPEVIRDKMFVLRCEDAARHLFRVATGLESMLVGETEILGQVKDAYLISKEAGGTGPFLNKLFQIAINLGKEARNKTSVNRGITSLGSAAAKLATDIKNPKKTTYGIIGCGDMGTVIAKNLLKTGVKKIHLSNRTVCKGKNLANEVGGSFLKLNKINQLIQDSDIVITATSADEFIITKEQIKKLVKNKKSFSIIDVSTPRNVDPQIADLGVQIYTIDDLKDIVDSNIEIRKSSIAAIESMIKNKLGFFTIWYKRRLKTYEEDYIGEPGLETGAYPDTDHSGTSKKDTQDLN